MINGARHPTTILFPGIRSRFAAAASFFVTTKRATNFGTTCSNVDIDNA